MAHIIADRVKETSATTGSGALTLAGAATGFQAFSAVMQNADTTLYSIEHQTLAEWEVGIGTWGTGGILTRTTVISSSNAGAAVVFSAGTKDVFITTSGVMGGYGELTPAQITVDQNDYNPAGLQYANHLRLDADQIRNITGLAGGYPGRTLRITNAGAGADSSFVIKPENASSAAQNRITSQTDVCLGQGDSAVLIYNGASSRWEVLSLRQITPSRKLLFYSNDLLGPSGPVGAEAVDVWDYAVTAGGASVKQTGETNHPGIIRLRSSTTTNGGANVVTDVTAFRISGGEFAEFVFRPVNLTTATIRFGFLDTLSATDASDGAYFEIGSTGVCVGKTANNATRTTSATIDTVVTNAWYTGIIRVNDAATAVTFTLLDASLTQLGQQTITTNIPTGAARVCGHGFVATKSGVVVEDIVDFDYLSVGILKAMVR